MRKLSDFTFKIRPERPVYPKSSPRRVLTRADFSPLNSKEVTEKFLGRSYYFRILEDNSAEAYTSEPVRAARHKALA